MDEIDINREEKNPFLGDSYTVYRKYADCHVKTKQQTICPFV